ncbi:MAG: pre-16S rRNA-processing nuclease YqgF [Parcubacteria group bacterium]|nr:pre-16S rRNA-processing nuclease YqgF [Parcubacteria group bacterium]
MKYIGIDYGAKKIGIALSDAGGTIAFPSDVIPNDEHAIGAIVSIMLREGAEGIVVGDTRTESGAANDITVALETFISTLERVAGVSAVRIAEAGTSGAARAPRGEGEARGVVSSARAASDEGVDARAAALILQRFLDVQPQA